MHLPQQFVGHKLDDKQFNFSSLLTVPFYKVGARTDNVTVCATDTWYNSPVVCIKYLLTTVKQSTLTTKGYLKFDNCNAV